MLSRQKHGTATGFRRLAGRNKEIRVRGEGQDRRQHGRRVEAAGGIALGIEVDVRDHEAVAAMVARVVQAWGLVDVLVANAVGGRGRPMDKRRFFCEPTLCDLFNNRRIYPSLRLAAILPGISDSEGEITGVKLRAIVAAMVIALTNPAFADTSDYESMHRRLADVLGSRAQADAAYDKLMKEANTYGQPIASVVDLFIAVCTASGECKP